MLTARSLQQVIVVRHQNVGMHSKPPFFTRFSQCSLKSPTVLVVPHDRFAPVPSRHHMVHGAREFDSLPFPYRTEPLYNPRAEPASVREDDLLIPTIGLIGVHPLIELAQLGWDHVRSQYWTVRYR